MFDKIFLVNQFKNCKKYNHYVFFISNTKQSGVFTFLFMKSIDFAGVFENINCKSLIEKVYSDNNSF